MSKEQLNRSSNPADNDFTPAWDEEGKLAGEFPAPPEEHRDDKHDRSGMSLKTKVGLFLAGLGIAGTGGLIGKSMGGHEAAPAPRAPEASAPANPGESNAPTATTEVETTPVSKYEISVADNPTFELAAQAYYDKYLEYQSSAKTYDEQGDPKYLVGMFGADWESNPELVDYVNYIRDGSVTVSTNHYATGEDGDTEYNLNIKIDEVSDVIEDQDGMVAGNVKIHATDNVMETVLAGFASTGVDLDSYGDYHLTFTDVDGHWQVTEVDNLNNNQIIEPIYQ